ncbi:hypothetical protein [Pseudocolwellia agarivorans]|uniref:hypothetical protein n=1 Tax=Pseudocolwellia agarivorans TaxID=1911682 RepID=UPI00098641C4|nr:hypothetical protein [Pseudocolwellia agarivorans]
MKTFIVIMLTCFFATSVFSDEYVIESALVEKVVINAGKDSTYGSTNYTSCVKFQGKGSESCLGGWIAIPANNTQLVSAVISAKSNKLIVRPFFVDGGNTLQCTSTYKTKCRLESLTIN